MIRRMTALCLAWCALVLAQPSQAQTNGALGDRVLSLPWQEATISVRNFDPVLTFLQDVGKYEVIAKGQIAKSQLRYWRLPNAAEAQYILLKEPGSTHGFIRLVKFSGVVQKPIRIGARAWDSGGYFSLMMRAKGLDDIFDQAIALGFQAESEPIRFQFAPSDLKNVVLKAPDGINFALYERLSPPLDDFWNFETLSQPFNAMQMVANTQVAHDFYRGELGMKSFFEGDFIDPQAGYNNFGLPQNLTIEIPRRTRILWPKPAETGRIEIMEFVGLDGRDLSARAQHPNLGILAVTYPVADVDTAYKVFRDAGGLAHYRLGTLEFAPYGKSRMFTVRSPDGALINVFQQLKSRQND